MLQKNRAGRPPCPNRELEISDQILIVTSQCPVCGSKEIITGVQKQIPTQKPRIKRAFDLVFTSTGVSRRVLAYRTFVYHCLTCSAEFIPDQYQRLDKHFHGLKSWAMYQHVAYRMSLETIPKMCEELFGIRIFRVETLMFKFLMARYYQAAYQKLLEKMISGTLLHVDETEVQLQNGKGYVWIFANIEEVVYMYRPTREGDFLRELLKNFHGVLVSDFYATYDGIECPQQKCLIHLMRDINQVLLDNPFDEELKAITKPFGALLRKIITTVDEHGLRRQYLQQHEVDVEQFFRSLGEKTISSEPAEALQVRLTKNRNKLFTFLNYDGVPWNNNNAEYAIKQFAYFRENTKGTMRAPGLKDYLVLSSICQTCKYKGVSFLRFLLSKEQDVDAFCQRQTQEQPLSSIELYPEGFVPQHYMSKHKKKARQERVDAEIPEPDETHEKSPL